MVGYRPVAGGRLAEIARNLVLLGGTAAHLAADDPLLLAVQTSRRLPPRIRSSAAHLLAAGTGRRPTVRGAFAAFLADRPDEVAGVLAASDPPRTATGRRLAAELAVHVGHPESAPGGMDSAPTVTKARAAWRRGDFTAAADLAGAPDGSARYWSRILSERGTLGPGFRLEAPPVVGDTAQSRAGEARVLHVLTNSLPHTGSGYAIRSHAVLLAQQEAGVAAEAVTRIGYPVTVGLPRARATDVVDGVTYRRILPARLADPPAQRLQDMAQAVAGVATQFRPTILHTTTNYANALVTEAVARALGLPWVYEVRGQLEATWVAALPPGERAAGARSERFALLRAKETEMMRAASHVVTLSETLRAEIVSRGVPEDRVTVVPNGVDEAARALRMEPAEARARLGLPTEGFWVGTVSALVDYEGLDTLLDAAALLRAKGRDVRVALVGDGVARPGLVALAARLGLGPVAVFAGPITRADVAVFPGRVSRADAPVWHRALDVFVVPRRDLEVCRTVTPLKPIEAMAAGRPVVASDLPALAEIVSKPGTGLLVTPGDVGALAAALAALHTDSVARSTYGEAGRRFAASRTWAASGLVYRKLYDELGVRE